MSLLAAHFDVSGVSFLIKKDKNTTEVENFPYVYSSGILLNQCSQKEFYTYLIQKLLTDRGIKINTCDILTSGFLDPPDLNLKTKFSIGTAELIQGSEEFVPVFLNNMAFITKGILNSYSPCRDKITEAEKDFGEFDQSANYCIYPQVVPDDISSQTAVDRGIHEKLPTGLEFETGRKVVFTGGRFSQNILNKELNYVLMLEIMRGLGVFDLYMDKSNAFLLSRIVQMYDKNIPLNVDQHIESVGTLIKTGGDTECLLSTGVGDDQFIEIEENKIFVMPLSLTNPARLSIKSDVLGTIDVRTHGGEIGLIFDTRTKDSSIYFDVKLLNDCIKQFVDALKE